jgi:hypothetical protein
MTLTRRQLVAAAVLGGGMAAMPVWAQPRVLKGGSDPRLAAVRAALASHAGRIRHRDRVGIADFSLPSREPRFFLVDLLGGTATAHLVAHGRGSDPAHLGWVERFSNEPGSAASSSGAYLTGEEYVGQHGRSRRLVGLDPTNDNAEARAIVIHAAWYVAPRMIAEHGKLGRSEGCLAFADDDLPTMLDLLGPGRLIVAGKFQSA